MWIILLLILFGVVYVYLKQKNTYWKKRGVKQGNPVVFFGDHAAAVFKQQTFQEMSTEIYYRFPNERYSGFYKFHKPALFITDLNLAKQIAIKDFDHFVDHSFQMPKDFDPVFTRSLSLLNGEEWREMRATISPAFTSSKMKAMFILMSECSENFANYFLQHPEECVVELRDIYTRYGNDTVATCAFGVTCNSLKDKDNEFYDMGLEATDMGSVWKSLKVLMYMSLPQICKLLGLTFFPKRVSDFFRKLVTESVKLREEKNIVRPDMIHLLMQAKNGVLKYEQNPDAKNDTGFSTVEESNLGIYSRKIKHKMTELDMTSQALIFFIAGFDGISLLNTMLTYELALNTDIQDKLYLEIQKTLSECNGKITYEALNKMEYLDMVISETLRKWPPASFSDRICVKDYLIKAQNPGEIDVTVEKGTAVWIPIFPFHRDPKYFPNPEKFDPERFNKENRTKINLDAYMPFGTGPRNCIGSRFALLESKILIFHLLSKMKFCVNEKTDIPMKFRRYGFISIPKNGCWITLKAR